MQYSQRIANLTADQRALLELRLGKQKTASWMPPAIPRRADDRDWDILSLDQERFWFIHQLDPDSPAYNLNTAYRLNGPLDVPALIHALNKIVERHEILRTSFQTVAGKPVQVIAPTLTLEVKQLDLRVISPETREAEAERVFHEHALVPFDLAKLPLVRALLVRIGEEEHRLLLTMHHIITDWWSFSLFNKELVLFYQAVTNGRPGPLLPALSIQYADFAAWQRQWVQGPEVERRCSYWKDELNGAPRVLDIPGDHPRLPTLASRGASMPLKLSKSLYQSIKSLSRAEEVTPFMTTLAAFQLLIRQYTGENDFLVGSPSANRNKGGTENLIGLFLNTLVLRAQISADLTCREYLRRVRTTVLGAYSHQDMPFGELVARLEPQRDLSRMALVQTSFVYIVTGEHSGFGRLKETDKTGLHIRPLMFDVGISKYDLSCGFWESETELNGHLEYNTDLLDKASVERMADQLVVLLEAMVSNPDAPISDLVQLTAADRQLLAEWNNTAKIYPQNSCVHELFEMQAARTPNAAAVLCEDEQVSYSELNARANQLAHYLRQAGAGPETLIGVMVQPSIDMVVSLLAILKAGAAYLPLDPTYPRQRLAFMLDDARPALLLTDSILSKQLPPISANVLSLNLLQDSLAGQSVTNLSAITTSTQLAYVIYTSGSTAQPKGVQVTHRSVVNLLHAMSEEPGLTAGDTLLSVTTLAFDIAGLELFLPLLNGAHVVLVSREVAVDGRLLADALACTQATVMQATPGTWRMMLAAGWQPMPQLKMLSGGEALSQELALSLTSNGAALWNMYGPTETTIWSSTSRVNCAGGIISLGRPIANTEFYVLNQQMRLAPIGTVGELFIGGDGLARSYLGQAALTAERFVPNPFSSAVGERLYRTGDLVKRRADGELEFRGRTDEQVKLRGFRIEPGEIEAAILEQDGTRECAVVVQANRIERGSTGSVSASTNRDKRLVAYIVEETERTVAEWRGILSEQLPAYMVPALFVRLEQLPRTNNGKVNRAQLAAETALIKAASVFVEPRSEQERELARIWEEVLGVERVGVEDNFFGLGGDSILSVQIVARATQAGLFLTPKQIFQHQTIAELAPIITPTVNQPRINEKQFEQSFGDDIEDIYPLSPTQQGMLFHSLAKPESEVYYQQMSCLLVGPLNVSAFKKAWQHAVDNHASLRIAVGYEDLDEPVQVVQKSAPLTIDQYDWRPLSRDEQQQSLEASLRASRSQKIDLTKAPLMRLTLIRLADERFQLVWDWHHLLMDGWSLSLVLDEVFDSYRALSEGRELMRKEPRYRDYIAWIRQQDFSEARTFWQSELKGFKKPTGLGKDHSSNALRSRLAKQQSSLSREATDHLKRVGREHRLTLGTILNAAWALVLNYHSGADDVTFGVTVSGRPPALAGVEQMVGLFINTLPLRVQVSPEKDSLLWLKEIQEKSTALRQYEHTSLVDVQAWSEMPPGLPLFETIVVLENYPVDRNIQDRAAGLKIENAEVVDWNNYPICLTVMPGDALSIEIKYDSGRYAGSTIARVMRQMETLLSQCTGNELVSELAKLLSDSDDQQRAQQEVDYAKNIRRKLSSVRRQS